MFLGKLYYENDLKKFIPEALFAARGFYKTINNFQDIFHIYKSL